MSPKEAREKKSKAGILHTEIVNSATVFIHTPHVAITPLWFGRYLVIGGGDCQHKIEKRNKEKLENWLKQTLKTEIKGTRSIEVKADQHFNILGFRMIVRR